MFGGGRIFFFLSSQKYFPTCVRQNAVALVACDAVDALPLVEARVGGAFVDVGLAVRACGATRNTLRKELGWRQRWTIERERRGLRDKTRATKPGY